MSSARASSITLQGLVDLEVSLCDVYRSFVRSASERFLVIAGGADIENEMGSSFKLLSFVFDFGLIEETCR